ncbi:MAG: IS3 family transposase, partial [Nitrospirales bacterium]|nr:IS3 family transposase [Nitrospirales bacterium]
MLQMPRSALHRRQTAPSSSSKLVAALVQHRQTLVQQYPTYGYLKLTVLFKREGWPGVRLYREEGLTLQPRSLRRRKAVVTRREVIHARRPNDVWSLDFVTDQLVDGRRFRDLTVLDMFTRECLAIDAGAHLRGEHVVAVLNQIRQSRSASKRLCCDQGSEFTSRNRDLWAFQHQVKLLFSPPGKPTDNAVIESFNGRFRDECLNSHVLVSIHDARRKIERWRIDYNEQRPHGSLG